MRVIIEFEGKDVMSVRVEGREPGAGTSESVGAAEAVPADLLRVAASLGAVSAGRAPIAPDERPDRIVATVAESLVRPARPTISFDGGPGPVDALRNVAALALPGDAGPADAGEAPAEFRAAPEPSRPKGDAPKRRTRTRARPTKG